MPGQFKVISVDDHVQEPPGLWTGKLSAAKFGDNIPHVAAQPDGTERWVVEGQVLSGMPVAETGALTAERFGTGPRKWGEVPAAVYEPKERLKMMDADGIDASVLYPTVSGGGGEVLASIKNADLQVACVQAYNDWLLETWAKASPRFIPQCLVPISSVAAAVAELERAVKAGHKGVIVPIDPAHLQEDALSIYSPDWDALWSKAQQLDVPVCFHSGSAPKLLLDLYPGVDQAVQAAFNAVREPVSSSAVLGKLLFSGIPERFPTLKFVLANSGVGWGSYSLEVCDHEWDRKFRQITPVEMKPPPYEMELPSDMFHRQCFLTASFDAMGLRVRDFIGVDNMLWHSEFPSPTSTYPNSKQTIAENFKGVPDDERTKILSSNAAKIYKLSL